MASERQLTLKQAKFVLYYVGKANGNASEAARRAGYSSPEIQGRQQLRKTIVLDEIARRLEGLAISANEILTRLTDHATSSVDDFIKDDEEMGFKLDLARARKLGRMHCVKKIKHNKYGVELELYDSQAAMDKLGKYHGLWRDTSNLTEEPDGVTDAARNEVRGKLARLRESANGNGVPGGAH